MIQYSNSFLLIKITWQLSTNKKLYKTALSKNKLNKTYDDDKMFQICAITKISNVYNNISEDERVIKWQYT